MGLFIDVTKIKNKGGTNMNNEVGGRKMMLKIVDGFNGWEDDKRFRSEERAEKMVARYERQFAAANPGAYSSYEIVP